MMMGAGGQVTVGIPSLNLAIVRTGVGCSIYEADNLVARLVPKIADAVTGGSQ